MYKNNSGLIAKTKVIKYNKGLCLIEKLMLKNTLLIIHKHVIYSYPFSIIFIVKQVT